MATLIELLKTTVEMGGSDLHITTETPPQVRVHGHLERLPMTDLAPSETKQLVYSVLTDAQKKRFEESLELDFSFGIRDLGRFRCNVFNQRGAAGAVYRLIPEKIRGFGELGLLPASGGKKNIRFSQGAANRVIGKRNRLPEVGFGLLKLAEPQAP